MKKWECQLLQGGPVTAGRASHWGEGRVAWGVGCQMGLVHNCFMAGQTGLNTFL